MKKIEVILFLLVAALLTSCATSQPKTVRLPESAFTSLFDGKTLNGWKLIGGKGPGYIVKDGVLICPADGGGDLLTEKEYSDFIVRLDFKLSPGGNNGLAIRSPMEKGQMAYIGNEIQILDDYAPKYKNLKPDQGNGSLYRILPAKQGALKKAGEWNSYEVHAMGREIKVFLNGQLVTSGNLNDVRDPQTLRRHPGMLRDRGHIGFLGHDSHVEFRNIRIHELPRIFERPNATPPVGFVSLFNGRDLTGWKGLAGNLTNIAQMSLDEWAQKQVEADELMRQNWKVEKGALVYRGKDFKGGKGFDNLCTARDDYADFEMLVDWKIEPKGDSGIYLRGYPQVQIWEINSGGVNKKHPGSGGLFNNEKTPNYASKYADRYVGEWNRFRILMVGDRVHVFLNDELVVNNLPLENFWERGKPLNAFGPIELQAHRSVVHFRNVYLREIPRPGEEYIEREQRMESLRAPKDR
ncbi:MAG: DUF1080 domain-containing protein [Verrucomicrobia bacterium]|nr:DUF1080 domain-containing protein [Verrucomicrobiota bacterium]